MHFQEAFFVAEGCLTDTSCLRSDTLLALRAPVGTTLEIPNASGQSRLWLTANSGKIEVYAITLPDAVTDLVSCQGIVVSFVILFFSNSRQIDIEFRKRRCTDSRHVARNDSKTSATKGEIQNSRQTLDYLTDIF